MSLMILIWVEVTDGDSVTVQCVWSEVVMKSEGRSRDVLHASSTNEATLRRLNNAASSPYSDVLVR